MHDRYTIGATAEKLKALFGIDIPKDFVQSFNAAPTQKLPVITTSLPTQIQHFYWGIIPKMANNKPVSQRLINLSLSSALSKPIHKKALLSNRCIILADGFYSWKQVSKKQRVPYYFYSTERKPFGIAGIWEEYEDFDGTSAQTFNMLVVQPDELLHSFMDDCPAILSAENCKKWLSNETKEENISAMLESLNHFPLNYHPVSPLINDLKIYDQRLIEPTQPADQFGNYTLF